MTTGMKPVQRIVSLFAHKACWKIEPLAAKLHYSIPSVRRFLSQIGYYSSFTHNAVWYTLRSIPRFGRNGLWFSHKIGFSRFGSLTKTLISMIRSSSTGMTAKQLGEELHCRCHSILVHLCRCEKLQRKKVGSSYVYLSIDSDIATNQFQTIAIQELSEKQLPAEIAVLVLTEFIHHPESGFEQLAKVVAHRKGVAINIAFIEKLFDLHKVKKEDENCSSKALLALRDSLERVAKETLPALLFPQPPVIRFVPERNTCVCGERLGKQKTRNKTVLSMTGPFVAHETVLECPACDRVFCSDALLRIVPAHCNVAYDVLVFVGKALFQRQRTTREIAAELFARNVRISASEIGSLGRKFILYLAVGHRRAKPQIHRAMKVTGGYILHLDAMHEDDAPVLMTGMDSLSKIVLDNVKIPSENADHIVPFLKTLKKDYGVPQACVHDMGTGICKAVAKVFPNTRDFICHFHFLRDIGKDFLEPEYRLLRNSLRKHGVSSRLRALAREIRKHLSGNISQSTMLVKAISKETSVTPKDKELLFLASTYSLVLWALRGKHNGGGYGFPFDRPLLEFAERLLVLARHLPEFMELSTSQGDLSRNESRGRKILLKLATQASNIAADPNLNKAIAQLRWRSEIFERLRLAMRIAPPTGGNGLNDTGTTEDMASIRENVKQFHREIENDNKLSADPLIRKMMKQLDNYGEKLFAEPIEVKTSKGKVILYPQRTNNILEQFFRKIRHSYRRKTGENTIHRALQAMLPHTPLVRNLENPDYMKIFLDGKSNLEELFAVLTVKMENAAESEIDTDCILPGYRALIKSPNFLEKIVSIFHGLKKSKKG